MNTASLALHLGPSYCYHERHMSGVCAHMNAHVFQSTCVTFLYSHLSSLTARRLTTRSSPDMAR